jgi:hypothetical protein
MTLSLACLAMRLSRMAVLAVMLPERLLEDTTRLCVVAARGGEGLALVPDHLLELADVVSPGQVRRVGRLAKAAVIAFLAVLAMIGFSAIGPLGGSLFAGSFVPPATAPIAAIGPDGAGKPSTCHGEDEHP